ncbi:hypothetical protein BLA60_41590 [Actinophytocola xinjiangensis]|uniref:Uncharacterized protein n=1 Tax=Actinophytocola xinjiangensis TaxID=485602 RepID=A0A7Z1AUK2_9PSEU|nr:hypothetical protein [Actinophytocola xinjiangensis]OLF04265.1 hypothetical protein BLA60_41590 [Actinophytocola xinjiangensis]
MPDIEDRLRCALHDLADEVPTTPDARAGLTRRLTGRPRSPVWAAAAAAVVVAAAVAVPVALSGNSPPTTGIGTGGAAPSVTTSPPESTNLGDIPWPYRTPRSSIGWSGEGAPFRQFMVAINHDGEVCYVLEGRYENPPTLEDTCEPMPAWGIAHVVESRALGHVDLPMPAAVRAELTDRMVFLLAPEVARLDVRRADGSLLPAWTRYDQLVGVAPVEKGRGFVFADFAGPTEGFGYTAYDSAGNVLEEAIT